MYIKSNENVEQPSSWTLKFERLEIQIILKCLGAHVTITFYIYYPPDYKNISVSNK